MTQWPGDGSPTSACVGCFEAWGQTQAGAAKKEMVSTAQGLESMISAEHCSGLVTTTLLNIHNNNYEEAIFSTL